MHYNVNMFKRTLLLYFVYDILLWGGYYFIVVPTYGGTGFIWKPEFLKVATSSILLLTLVLIVLSETRRTSSFYLNFQLMFPIFPVMILYAAQDLSSEFPLYVACSFLFLVFSSRVISLKKIGVSKFSNKHFGILLLIIAISYVLSIILLGGLSYFNLDFNNVYLFRESASSNLPDIFAYLSPWISKVILPMSFILAIDTRQRFLALISFFMSFLMFSLTNHKAPLFYPLASYLLYRCFLKQHSFMLFISCVVGVFGITLFLSLASEDFNILGSLIYHRMSFVPAQLNYYYYDYFTLHEFVFWAESKVTLGLIEYAYSQPSIYLIGDEYFGFYGREGRIAANTGWLGTGYMHGGFIGMLLYSLIIGSVLKTLDTLEKTMGRHLVVAFSIAPMMALLLSADLPNAFLTHGVILMILLMLFVSHSRKYPELYLKR